MKKLKSLTFLTILVLYLSVICNGEDEILAAPMEKTELDSLYSAIQSFVGKWWNGSDLYPDPCGWTPIQGVSCDLYNGLWYVTELNIGSVHDNSLSCARNAGFSPYLFALRHLKSLSFFNCFVSHPIPIPTQNWELLAASLESLEFRSNPGLTGQIPVTFGELKNLKSLVLVEIGLTGELLPCLGNLFDLRRLNLAGNLFTGLIPDNFGGLNHLLILDISKNSLSGPLPYTLGGLTSLLKLDLSYNQLEGKIPEEIGNLKNLTLLDLSNNRLSNGLTNSLQNLCSLEELVLSNNPVGGYLMNLEWRNLRGLVALDLSKMSLTGGIPDSFTGLKGIRFLGLNNNKLTGDIPQNLASLPSITTLYLHGNNLTGELKFSAWFYGKLGRRFGAWDNPNLCYPIGLIPASYAPFGVKKCQQEVTRFGTHNPDSRLGNGNWHHDYNPVVSLGFSACGVGGPLFTVGVSIVMIFNFFPI
ncbi:Leucine-rich repeat (LRR) protein associated with apoptosis in muscle tissue [Handroanthus impetiginosus]|uniref:Leucine-rich repeat (LRR) protein associated with apoptosis in muscle tissue n=1 Tax=Handroanthus impetiginosus TaxID=429701 RepID=A0A2G9G785_9LAMI|nr:Leucine-rich repeat (LRR) protein associated with apoptosis in muscle tissue [Handroanthus impetiginosus]